MSLIYLTQFIPMDGRIGDAVQGPKAQNETGANQSPSIILGPIDHRLRRIRRKFDAIEIRSYPPEVIGYHS